VKTSDLTLQAQTFFSFVHFTRRQKWPRRTPNEHNALAKVLLWASGATAERKAAGRFVPSKDELRRQVDTLSELLTQRRREGRSFWQRVFGR
jgi:hypothetical protein